MDKRLRALSNTLSEFSLGRFDKKIRISPRHDELDAVISGINMLGDELKSVTIARNYFTGIFNAVTDMVIILDTKGVILDVNQSCEIQLSHKKEFLSGKRIDDLCEGISLSSRILKVLKNGTSFSDEINMVDSDDKLIPVRLTGSQLTNENNNKLILLTANNISLQRKTENLVIRAMIDAQEKERQRLAKDLHDGLIQQLTAIKFFVGSIVELTETAEHKSLLYQSNDELSNAIAEVRDICFDLMPQTLQKFPLIKAIETFCTRISFYRKTTFKIRQAKNVPDLNQKLKIDLYRIIQEFISNAINHGEATKIDISLACHNQNLKVKLSDDGKGFNVQLKSSGMGLRNIKSRIKSHSGTLSISSLINEGTSYQISIPTSN